MNKYVIPALFAVVSMLFIGCFPEEDSSNIKTAGIYVQFEVVEQGDNATATATFWVGDDPGGTYLDLTGGDAVEINGVNMTERGSNPKYYQAALDAADEYEFVFSRPDEDPYSSTVTDMPMPVIVTGPSQGDIARDEEFEVTWEDNSGGNGDILLTISGDCIWDYPDTLGDDVADSGSYVVSADELEVQDLDEGETCTAEVELKRSVNGVLSDSLKGTIKGATMDTSSFNSTPAAHELSE